MKERKIEKVLIIENRKKKDVDILTKEITDYLTLSGISNSIYGFKGKPGIPDLHGVDLVFSLGGDGTVLYAARIAAERNIPILAVNLGYFGFVTEVSKNEWKSAFEKYRKNLLGISRRLMLKVSVLRKGVEVSEFIGLNDAVISAEGIAKVVKLNVRLKDTALGTYRADGIIAATPTGSTAYSAAAGGPILDPEMEALVLNPICPFTLSNRPLVIPGDQCVYAEVEKEQRTRLILTVDGQIAFPLKPCDVICFGKYEKKALLIRSDKRNFYEVLREKLKWSGGPDA